MSYKVKVALVREQKSRWNKKVELNVGDNKLYKVIGIGPKAFKVLWFGKTPGSKVPTWNQCWWRYKELDEVGLKVLDKLYNELRQHQITLDDECNGDCGGCSNLHECHDLG